MRFIPDDAEDTVHDIVSCFRMMLAGMNATAAHVSNPDRFEYVRIVEGRNLDQWNKHLADFDRITAAGNRRAG